MSNLSMTIVRQAHYFLFFFAGRNYGISFFLRLNPFGQGALCPFSESRKSGRVFEFNGEMWFIRLILFVK